MKMRQVRKMALVKVFYSLFRRFKVDVGNYIPTRQETIAIMDMCDIMVSSARKHQVARKKDGVVVLETESLEEAQALIDKHARQKKASLVLINADPLLIAV